MVTGAKERTTAGGVGLWCVNNPTARQEKKPPTLSVSITQGERAAARLAGYRRQALEILSGAGSRGCTTLLAQMAQGFTTDTLAGLVRDGLATAAPETVMAGGRTIEITRVKITDAARRALGYKLRLPLYLPIAR